MFFVNAPVIEWKYVFRKSNHICRKKNTITYVYYAYAITSISTHVHKGPEVYQKISDRYQLIQQNIVMC